MAEQLDDETLAFAHRTFDLARAGHTDELTSLLDGGLLPNLTNDKGETLLILATFFELPDMLALLQDG